MLSDGTEQELLTDGGLRSVGFDDRAEYVRLCLGRLAAGPNLR